MHSWVQEETRNQEGVQQLSPTGGTLLLNARIWSNSRDLSHVRGDPRARSRTTPERTIQKVMRMHETSGAVSRKRPASNSVDADQGYHLVDGTSGFPIC